jgi:hypothetical protein
MYAPSAFVHNNIHHLSLTRLAILHVAAVSFIITVNFDAFLQAPLAQTQGYMDVQIDDGRIRDWKLLYGVLKGDKILLWRDELDEVHAIPYNDVPSTYVLHCRIALTHQLFVFAA